MGNIRIVAKKIILSLAAILLLFVSSPNAHAKEDRTSQDFHKFEITGEITAIAGNNFVVSGQTIFIDPIHVRGFEQKGILAVGEKAKVEVVLENGVKFAKKINVIGTGQGRFKFKEDDHAIFVGTTAAMNTQVKVKANGSIQQVETFLNQVLALLKSFIS